MSKTNIRRSESKRGVGTEYELMAADWLRGKGFHILEMNFRSRYGEIDIVAREKTALVFVEVKYRKTAVSGTPWEAVDLRKQYRICRMADYYLLRNRAAPGQTVRFDVVAVRGGEMLLFRNAFPYLPVKG